ncbi:MAG: glycosyltransferase [Anaerolineales bacterium]|nr:glycosyltransferase [Anaerolineales bacterium]
MRIATISYHTCPLATLGGKDTGGMNVYIRELTKQLGHLGVHVDVFTRSQDEHVPHVLHDLGYGNRVVHVPAGPETPLSKDELQRYVGEFAEGILEFIEKKDLTYDLIHSHYWLSGLVAIELSEIWKIPIIHMFHTLGVMKQRVAKTPNENDGDFRLKGEKKILQRADKIVAATPAEYAQLQWLYQADMDQVVVIPPGVDISHFYPIPADEAREFIGVPPCESMLLFVGRIEPLKGLDTLIEIIELMRKNEAFSHIPFCLLVIGGDPNVSDSDELNRLQHLTKKYGVEKLVTFLGKRNQDVLPYYYSAARAVVVPSHYESFGMVALESMACGTPVVASHVGGLAFLIQDGRTGFTVPVDDHEMMVEKLSALLIDHELHQKMSNQAAEFAKQYRWELIAEQILDLYSQCLKEK